MDLAGMVLELRLETRGAVKEVTEMDRSSK